MGLRQLDLELYELTFGENDICAVSRSSPPLPPSVIAAKCWERSPDYVMV